jgi:hypothetical protein
MVDRRKKRCERSKPRSAQFARRVLLMCMALSRRGHERGQGSRCFSSASAERLALTAPVPPARPYGPAALAHSVYEPQAGSKAVARQDGYNTISEQNKLPILGTLSTDAAFLCAKDMAMSANTKPFSVVTFQDGSEAWFAAIRARRAFSKSSQSSRKPNAPETTPTEKTAGLPSLHVSRLKPRHNGVSNRLRQHRN